MSQLFINHFYSLIIQLATKRQSPGHMETIDYT